MRMQRMLAILAMAGVMVMGGMAKADVVTPTATITLDTHGNGYFLQAGSHQYSSLGGYTSYGSKQVLTYENEFVDPDNPTVSFLVPFATGDVKLEDNGDVIRFLQRPTGALVIEYWSFNTVGAPTDQNGDPIDLSGAKTVLSGRSYTAATKNDPGYIDGFLTTYVFQADQITGSAVPLPAAAWAGMALLGVMGARKALRRGHQ